MTFFSRPVVYVWRWKLAASPIELWPEEFHSPLSAPSTEGGS